MGNNKSKSELVRLALAERGPSTAAELADSLDVEVNNVGALLTWDINHGRIDRGWKGKLRIYGLPGTIKNPSPVIPRAVRKKIEPLELPRPDITVDDSFWSLAEKARLCEQVNQFADAAPLWLVAADLATSAINQHWCRSRSDFCVRGWKYPEVAV
ncbi:ANR family transcriptional regulator [Serratia marcescens]|uniref:ANR family transcriptional regulator n=1 Tax=Serratia marcescens TaxID=615 RepID=UPI0027493CDF|nr:ANR family transcriptional regulator [Serratia marcescens]MDP8639004.1 ANR family transcriptional regulator [Serratia marcescens]MDP8832481.1 ANR family transcriptional regulator [Serratia marcescens]